MGISGLLPALKSIQVTKPLSAYAGQTIAVDGYVWLHRGILTCAPELATGKKTHKYVDYAMQRVRLLRHHKINPYIVFDGGPLPAKKGTETERKRKREESLARANALAAQGKHGQAREYYLKCVDVTPAMAYQFIKALRAESVPYVVAPYEADAQLAYLERVGIVDGILTEDSDLLVFGCQNVLFKLDTTANTVVSVMRKDFGTVAASASDSNGISLVGWSDVQFRAMAILSGCDYLPSIHGIGLKTACTLLRKWKTVEQVIRVIQLEGKKAVPSGYLKQFKLAEICFLHQRVYCPNQEKLVHLTDVAGEWNDELDHYVGRELDAALAKRIALGEVDPATLLPIDDIHPGFTPGVLKALPFVTHIGNRQDKGKGKEKTPVKEGILSFFGPNPIIPPKTKKSSLPPAAPRPKKANVSKGSGKRTLAEVMESETTAKHQKRSKFFESQLGSKTAVHSSPIAGPSRLIQEKENIFIVVEDDDGDSVDNSAASVQAQISVCEVDFDEDMNDEIGQEDGYISPTPSFVEELQDLSSPARPGSASRKRADKGLSDNEDFDADPISSPPVPKQKRAAGLNHPAPPRTYSLDSSLARRHSTRSSKRNDGHVHCMPISSQPTTAQPVTTVDLEHIFGDTASDIDTSGDEEKAHDTEPDTASCPSQGLCSSGNLFNEAEPSDVEESEARAAELRRDAVINGWRERWTRSGKASMRLQRTETNVTPAGRHSLPSSPWRDGKWSASRSSGPKTRHVQARKSLPFLAPAGNRS